MSIVVKKNQVISRPSKSGNGVNLIVDGSFCYLDQDTYDRIMADDSIGAIEVGDAQPILDKDTKEPTGIYSRAIVQFVESDQARLDNAIALQEKALTLDASATEILRSLGITI